jgi:hypothetical protein
MVKIDRAVRKAAKAEKKAAKSIRLQAGFIQENPLKEPKIEALPDIEKLPKSEVAISTLQTPKQIRINENGSRFGLEMTWCARKGDSDGAWSWGEPRAWEDIEWKETILAGLNNLEGLDWQEIQNQSSDSGHLMHHNHDIDDIANEAIERWLELGLEEFDVVFRFRLGNTKRAWGIVLSGHFYMIWWERNHKIYDVD